MRASFLKKINLAKVTYDYSDETKDQKQKQERLSAINELIGMLSDQRMVTNLFIPNIENKPEIDHINTIKIDNTVFLNEDGSVNYDKTNLRWVTPKENSNNPLSIVNKSESKKGIKNHRHQPVLQYDKDGNFIREWDTMTEAETTLNITHKIHYVCQGKRKTCGGYIWKYKRTA